MKRALLLKYDDWQALYVDDVIVAQGHRITVEEMMAMAEKHDFKHSDTVYSWASKEDEEYIEDYAAFPEKRSELKGDYK